MLEKAAEQIVDKEWDRVDDNRKYRIFEWRVKKGGNQKWNVRKLQQYKVTNWFIDKQKPMDVSNIEKTTE